MRRRGTRLTTDNTKLLDALDSILRNEDLEAKNMRDDRMPNMLCILLGGKEELERNAHSEPREPIGTSIVDCGTRWCAWCALYAHRLCSVRLPAQLAHMSHAALCCLLAPAKPARQDTRRGAVCRANRQPPVHSLPAPRPLANGLCEALGRHARGSFDFCAVLLKNNTAGLATALEATVDRAKRQQPQLDVSRRNWTWSVRCRSCSTFRAPSSHWPGTAGGQEAHTRGILPFV